MMDYTDFKCEFLKSSQIRKITDDFRKEYWSDNVLPVNMEQIIGQGIKLDIIPESNFNTRAYLKSDLSAIVVDLNQYMDEMDRYSNRLRFSFAHEVGHYVLHRSIYENFEVETEEEYLLFIKNIPEEEYQGFEWQANEFAGSLLVPRKRLIKEVMDIYESIKQKNLLKILERYPNDILARVSQKLCKPFGVSTNVIERRVEVEQIWPPNIK